MAVVVAAAREDLNAISTVTEEGALMATLSAEDDAELLAEQQLPRREPVVIRGAGNVTVLVPTTAYLIAYIFNFSSAIFKPYGISLILRPVKSSSVRRAF